jgi:predicted dehydrogenase
MTDRLRIGIVGGGMISQIAHLPFYLADRRCELWSVAESRPSLQRHLREAIGIERVVDEPAELYADPAISAVIIVAPRPATAALALAALQAGKDVLVEKPMAHTVQQAAQLVDAARRKNLLLGVAFMKRYDPGVQAAKREFERLVLDQTLGPLLFARFYDFARDYAHSPPPHKRPEESRVRRFETWPTAPDWLPSSRSDDYAWFMNAASHDINLLHFFLPDGLRLVGASSPSAGRLVAMLERDGVPVIFELAKSASGVWLQGAEFVFEQGRLLVELPSPMAQDRAARVRVYENLKGPRIRELEIERVWSFQRQAQGFISNVFDRRAPLTSGADALEDLRLIEAVWRLIFSQC